MLLILARHGNTFEKGEKTYRVGNAQDLPLVEKGLEQAQAFASALIEKSINPVAIYCGPLQRTRTFAGIIASKLDISQEPIVDVRLDELNYGAWSGLADDKIKEKFGSDLDNWEKHGKWPENSRWPESEKDVIHKVKSFVRELTIKYRSEDVVLAVTSNGKVRYFLKLIEHEFDNKLKTGTLKVGTGNACVVAHDGKQFEIVAWNINPAEL
jgi:probable phosphoglycerate mutase